LLANKAGDLSQMASALGSATHQHLIARANSAPNIQLIPTIPAERENEVSSGGSSSPFLMVQDFPTGTGR